jgi:hypothetical protein
VLSDIHLIFGTLLYHTKIQIKFEYAFDALIFHFHQVMALGLRKISGIPCFLHFLARQDDCPESYCHDPCVGVGVTPQGKNFNLGYIF